MSQHKYRILIVDDDEDILVAGKLLLKRHFGEVLTANDPERIPGLLEASKFDAILLDMNFCPGESSGEAGFTWLRRILELDPDAVVVMVTAHGNVNVAVEAMKHGATDFIAKPWQNEKVVATLSAAVKLSASRAEAELLKRSKRGLAAVSSGTDQPLLGKSRAMADVLSLIARSAPTDANILITGENGTGKELAARQIHQQSLRSGEVFMAVDLGAVSETLFESEMFGHCKGAFTGATEDRVGRLEAANGGTLFLDEIGNIPLHLQAKLLTVLEQRKVTPVGRNEAVDFDVRVISATNISREQLADEKHFRQDLLFRLNTVELTLPSLRERPEDIQEITNWYADLYARKYQKPKKGFSSETLTLMKAYAWPGNIRALRHAVERAVILSESDTFEASDLQLDTTTGSNPLSSPPRDATGVTTDDLNLERMEMRAVQAALQRHRYNISKAAKELGLTRAALYRRMEKHGL